MTRALKIKGKFYTSFTSACDLNGISSPNVYRKMKKHKLSMTKAIESIIDYKNKRLLDHKGNEFKSYTEMAEYWNIPAKTLFARLKRKWYLKRALTQPVQHKTRNNKNES